MQTKVQPATDTKSTLRAGQVVSGLVILFLLVDGIMKVLMLEPSVVTTVALGYSANQVLIIGLIELAFLIVHLIPRTSAIGAILLTAFLGGAAATHVRVGDPFFFPIVMGALLWVGFALRDQRVRSFLLSKE